jgi:hypothetical protein
MTGRSEQQPIETIQYKIADFVVNGVNGTAVQNNFWS